MAFTAYVVLAARTKAVPGVRQEDGRPVRAVSQREEPFGYHATEWAAKAAKVRWSKRIPSRKWRVAALAEGAA